MLPRFPANKLVLGWGRFRKLQPGDIVILKHDGLEKIKQITRIRKDYIFVIGTNDAKSTDSRQFGWINRESVIAKVIY